MKRIHIHISVEDLQQGINFYSALFGGQPSKTREDYAKWQLDDPGVNFAISSRGHKVGVNHLGIQVDKQEDLDEISKNISAAEIETIQQDDAACCYAQSNKHWTFDPAGIAWESFHTLADIEVFGEDSSTQESGACCIPTISNASDDACCVPNTAGAQCC